PGGLALTPGQPGYASNDLVQITATPDPGMVFCIWTGSIANTNTVVNLVMDGTKTITGIFGQPITNDGNYDGAIAAGETNYYAVAANAGDSVLLRVGQLSSANYFNPWLRVYGPDGALVGSGNIAGDTAEEVAFRATNSGTFTVVVSDGNYGGYDGTGTYELHYLK